jgi:hypothetical protein
VCRPPPWRDIAMPARRRAAVALEAASARGAARLRDALAGGVEPISPRRSSTERRRSRTFQPAGNAGSRVLKTRRGTGPGPLQDGTDYSPEVEHGEPSRRAGGRGDRGNAPSSMREAPSPSPSPARHSHVSPPPHLLKDPSKAVSSVADLSRALLVLERLPSPPVCRTGRRLWGLIDVDVVGPQRPQGVLEQRSPADRRRFRRLRTRRRAAPPRRGPRARW